MEKLTLGELNLMNYVTSKTHLEALGYRLTSYHSNEKAGKVLVQTTFRSTEGAVHFHYEYREKRSGQRVDEIVIWQYSQI